MPSDGRRAPYIKATTRRRESDLTSSPYRPNYRESHHSEAERSILFQKSKKDKWRQIDSPPLPPSSTRPREKRRRSTSPSKPRSQRPRYDNLHTSRLPSPSRSSRIETRRCDNLGCGLQHSHDDCNRPMQCRGCRSTQHFGANCHEFCVECGQIGHIKAYCSEFVVGSDGKSRPKGWSRYMILLSVQACPQESADFVFQGVFHEASTRIGRRITSSRGFGQAPKFARTPLRLSPAPQQSAL